MKLDPGHHEKGNHEFYEELIGRSQQVDSPGGASGKEPPYQRRRYKRRKFDLWVGKIP